VQDKLGFVVFSEELQDRPAQAVRDAAAVAGFEDFVRDLSDRSAFIRATHRLVKDGIVKVEEDSVLRDKILDNENEVAFQFSQRHLETAGVDYTKSAVVRFDKKSGLVTCSDERIAEMAKKLCATLKGILTPTDINSLVRRVVEKQCKRVALRDAVYFIPVQRRDMLDALREFYKALGFFLTVLPIGLQDNQRENIIKATVKDLRENIQRVSVEIETLKGGDKLTPRIARNRIKDLKRELEQYHELAESLQADAKTLFEQAGDASQALLQAAMPVDSLIAAVQQGHKMDPLVFDLLGADPENKPVIEAINVAVKMQDVDLADVKNSKTILTGDETVHAMNIDLVGTKGGRK